MLTNNMLAGDLPRVQILGLGTRSLGHSVIRSFGPLDYLEKSGSDWICLLMGLTEVGLMGMARMPL